MKRRFIVVVLDGFGMGAMADAISARPGDETAGTLRSILEDYPDLKLPNLEKLGLMNAYGKESNLMKFNPEANFGKSELMHFGADTFMGHQEIMGTLPKKPDVQPFQTKVEDVYNHLKGRGYKVEYVERQGLRYVVCEDYVTIADNLEADLGMCYNVTAPLDYCSFEKELEIAECAREVVTVGRVIAFGGTGNTMQDLWNAEEIREGKFIGIASAKSKSYEQGYECRHLGYGVNKNVQAPTILTRNNIPCILIGKVADIVANDQGESISCVPTSECMELTYDAMKRIDEGFICTNVQETDLAGHSQSTKEYKHILELADKGFEKILAELQDDDVLVVMADHGNDPKIGSSRHTRECVPLLIKHKDVKGFMIQGGDPTGTGMGGSEKTIKGEFLQNGVVNNLKHERGVLSMARTMDPNSASSQFFIMHEDAPHLDGAYAAFGKVTKGIEVVDEIANVETDFRDKPIKPQVIKTIKLI